MDDFNRFLLRRRMHGLYLSRGCENITRLSHELLGLHCWFHRNVAFSALIRGTELSGWKHALTKTWLYRGTLHGVNFSDLPLLLALHARGGGWEEHLGADKYKSIIERVTGLMEDGVYSRAEMRYIFASEYDKQTIDMVLSPWGGIFCELARLGKVAFRNMTSRDFDLIEASPTQSPEEALPVLFRQFINAYGPATLDDAAWFFGLWKERKKELTALDTDEYLRAEHDKRTFFYTEEASDCADIPELTLLSGFDPYIVSYAERGAMLPPEYKPSVIMKSGICLPSIAVNGRVAGLWNIKKNEPVVQFFSEQPKRIIDKAEEMASYICAQTRGQL